MSWCRWQKDCWINYIRILCTIMLLYDRILNFTKLLKILFFYYAVSFMVSNPVLFWLHLVHCGMGGLCRHILTCAVFDRCKCPKRRF